MKYRKKPVVIEATRWFKNGDHPEDQCLKDVNGVPASEGNVVRYFRRPDIPSTSTCKRCRGEIMHNHGWIDTSLEGGHIVCPGDWIIAGVKGDYYSCSPDIFEATYEKVEEDQGR